jgi:hypothetical protein
MAMQLDINPNAAREGARDGVSYRHTWTTVDVPRREWTSDDQTRSSVVTQLVTQGYFWAGKTSSALEIRAATDQRFSRSGLF